MQTSKFFPEDSSFPNILTELERPVKSINVLGELPKDTKLVAIVGTRNSTSYGEQIAYQLACDLARAGIVVVSGLARGIDGWAHRGAVEAGGRTIAVLGHGLDRIYPTEHRGLAKSILAGGGVLISEYDEGTPPLPHQFLERNRIIAAMSEITVVVESAIEGGSLNTAREAIKIGRQVMAVPGNLTSHVSAGTNSLIRTHAAMPLASATDIITELGFIAHEAVPVPARSPEEATIIKLLAEGASSTESLITQSGLSAAQFANIISLMEITGKVRNLGTGQWVRR